MRTRLSLLIPVVALAVALTACGDGGPSKSDFTTKADGSCVTGNSAIASAQKPTTAPQVATLAGTVVTTVDGQVTTLRAMKMPGGDDRKQIEGIIGALGEVSAPTRALQDAAGKNDEAAMAKAAVEMQAKVDGAAASAQAYGLAQCGTGLKPAIVNVFDGTKSILKGSYTAKAEGLCKAAYRKVDAVTPAGNSGPSVGRFLDAVLAISVKLATDIRALPAPPGDEATVAEFGTAMDNLNAKIKETSAAAKANNQRLAGALSDEIDVAATALNAKLDAYGLTTCGTSGE